MPNGRVQADPQPSSPRQFIPVELSLKVPVRKPVNIIQVSLLNFVPRVNGFVGKYNVVEVRPKGEIVSYDASISVEPRDFAFVAECSVAEETFSLFQLIRRRHIGR